MEKQINLNEWKENFLSGMYDNPSFETQCKAGWYDWFCKTSSLARKTQSLGKKVVQIMESDKIDCEKSYVFFKNNCPCVGSLYDDFRICDIKTGDVIYTITPKSGMSIDKGKADVWGTENNFAGPLVSGTWRDVKNFFGI